MARSAVFSDNTHDRGGHLGHLRPVSAGCRAVSAAVAHTGLPLSARVLAGLGDPTVARRYFHSVRSVEALKGAPAGEEHWVTDDRKSLGHFVRHSTCRFCQSPNMVKVLDLGEVPLAGAFLREDQFAEERFYPLEVQFCVDCTL